MRGHLNSIMTNGPRSAMIAGILALFVCAAARSQPIPGSYTWRATSTPEPGAIGMQDWIEAPAGKYGRITSVGDKLLYNGGTIKLWGINLCYASCAPKPQLADRRAAFYAKYGVNSVRFHKYADGPGWAGIQSEDSFLEFRPDALDRMDYQVAKFKEQGIYIELSSTFGVKLGPGDRKYVPYMDEFRAKSEVKGRSKTGQGSIYISEELQDLQIRQVTNLLNHLNPHTGLRYAEDPAIFAVELFNEDSALWFGLMQQLKTVPTLRKRAEALFSDWLILRYGDHDGLVKAWGKNAINGLQNEGFSDEDLSKRNIAPAGNPWFYDPDQLQGSQSHLRQRFLDTMLFLYGLQNGFYDRYVRAVRATGFDGEIVASNWQAGRAFSHYYNLHSDARAGIIDRHNYFAGRVKGGGKRDFKNVSMLWTPGSGTLSSGMQQVAHRPFMISEWIHLLPNEWGAEGPAIISAYGMGLNGWDVSYLFQNGDRGGFSKIVYDSRWDVMTPQTLGLFPAIARQVYRDDVWESSLLAVRNVHVPSLIEGKLGFSETMTQDNDIKVFDGDKVPSQALAVARTVVDFTDTYQETPAFDLRPYQKGDALVSSTGQLEWVAGKSKHDGHFTLNTPASKAVVGFAQGLSCSLGDVTIESQTNFAAIYVTAQEKDRDIASSSNILIMAIARARNTGQEFDAEVDTLVAKGDAPILLEPVKAMITLRKEGQPKVVLLDHDGLLTDKTIPVEDGRILIDGQRDQTPYYLVQY